MIEQYAFGKIVINGHAYHSDVIIFEEQVRSDWWRKTGHELSVIDVEPAVEEYDPTAMVVGTGKFGMMKILPETKTFLHSRQIRLFAQKTGQAWNTFNELLNSEKVLGAFHLTC